MTLIKHGFYDIKNSQSSSFNWKIIKISINTFLKLSIKIKQFEHMQANPITMIQFSTNFIPCSHKLTILFDSYYLFCCSIPILFIHEQISHQNIPIVICNTKIKIGNLMYAKIVLFASISHLVPKMIIILGKSLFSEKLMNNWSFHLFH